MKGHVVYAKSTGLEVVAITRSKKKGDYVQKWGSLRLRFFEMEKEKRSIKVLCNCIEAHRFARTIRTVVKQKPEKPISVLFHSYKKEKNRRIETSVKVEYWKKKKEQEKEGFAILLQQSEVEGTGDDRKVLNTTKINVPISKDEILFLADLLQHLAMEQSWFTSVREEVEEQEVETETPSSSPDGSVEEVDDLEEVDEVEDIDF